MAGKLSLYDFQFSKHKIDQDDHLELTVCSTAIDDLAPASAAESECLAAQRWARGVLGQLGMAVLNELTLAGQNHGCDRRLTRLVMGYGARDFISGDGCQLYLYAEPGDAQLNVIVARAAVKPTLDLLRRELAFILAVDAGEPAPMKGTGS